MKEKKIYDIFNIKKEIIKYFQHYNDVNIYNIFMNLNDYYINSINCMI